MPLDSSQALGYTLFGHAFRPEHQGLVVHRAASIDCVDHYRYSVVASGPRHSRKKDVGVSTDRGPAQSRLEVIPLEC